MLYGYSHLATSDNTHGRDDEAQQQQEVKTARPFSVWLLTLVLLLFFTNVITLLGCLYWASRRELSVESDSRFRGHSEFKQKSNC